MNNLLQKTRHENEDERFLTLLNTDLAEGFPNPNRIGCPDSEFLQRLARRQIPISDCDPWIDHLGSCSECFGAFNQFRVAIKSRSNQRLVLYAAAACIILAGAGLLWRQFKTPGRIATPVANSVTTNPSALKGSPNGREGIVNTAANTPPVEVMVDLRQSATRGGKDSDASHAIRMPARLLACRLILPLGSSEGPYYVQVQRVVRSKVLKTAQGNAAITDGDVRLDVELDLSNISPGKYLLSYRRAGESWHRAPISITN